MYSYMYKRRYICLDASDIDVAKRKHCEMIQEETYFKGIDKITISIFEVWNQMVASTGWKQRQVMESRGEIFLFVRI